MKRALTLSPALLAVSVAGIALVAGAAGFGLAHLGKAPAGAAMSASENRKVLYWYDPMVPSQHFAKPGKSPFMDMQLVARYAGDADPGQGGVQIDPARLQSLGMRLATVSRGDFAEDMTVAGQLDFNQRDVAIVQARANGFVQRVYAHAPGDSVAVAT